MKSIKLLFTLLFVVGFISIGFGQGEITGSAHDFSGGFTWNTNGEICNVCHAPHNNKAAVAGSPLWNHSRTTETFIMYDENVQSGTMQASLEAEPLGVSKLCLSCHDGSINLGAFGMTVLGADSAGINNDRMTSHALVGTDLSNDHPISFLYDAQLVIDDQNGASNPQLADPTINPVLALLSGTNTVECSSCHDVHNNGPSSANSLLRVDNIGSLLCKTCHLK